MGFGEPFGRVSGHLLDPRQQPVGAAQVDIGQSCASTRLKSSLTTPDCFMGAFQTSSRLQQLMKHDRRRRIAGRSAVSRATTYETPPTAAGMPTPTPSPKQLDHDVRLPCLSGLARFRGVVFEDPEFG